MSKRTLDDYKELGATIRLSKAMLNKVMESSEKNGDRETIHQLDKAMDWLRRASYGFENQMLEDFPELGPEYSHVFNGDFSGKPIDEMDRDVYQIAESLAEMLV